MPGHQRGRRRTPASALAGACAPQRRGLRGPPRGATIGESADERSRESWALIPPRKGRPPKRRDSQEVRFFSNALPCGGRFHFGALIGRPFSVLCRITKNPIFLRDGLLVCSLSRT